jgi:hypothetical protein
MSLLDLVKEQRYLFVKNNTNSTIIFRANFHHIINGTIMFTLLNDNVYNISKNRNMETSMPLIWIKRYYSLYDIIGKKINLPKEICDIIDLFL